MTLDNNVRLLWEWVIDDDSQELVVSPRTYKTEDEAQEALDDWWARYFRKHSGVVPFIGSRVRATTVERHKHLYKALPPSPGDQGGYMFSHTWMKCDCGALKLFSLAEIIGANGDINRHREALRVYNLRKTYN